MIKKVEEKTFDLRDVFLLVSSIPNILGKAYVTFILSSGLQKEALNLTIGDLINACDSAFYSFEKKNLKNLLLKDPTFICPMWEIKNNNLTKITFSSPESTFYIFFYLKEEIKNGKEISLDDKIFGLSKQPLPSVTITRMFNYEKKAFVMSNKYKAFENDLGKDYMIVKFDELYDDYHFTSKDLMNFFRKICFEYFPEFTQDPEKLRNHIQNGNHPIKKNMLVKLFNDGLPEDNRYFQEFYEHKDKLITYYHLIEEHLTVKYHDKIYPNHYFPYPEYNEYLTDKFGDFVYVPFTNLLDLEEFNKQKNYSERICEYTNEEIKYKLINFLEEKEYAGLNPKYFKILYTEAKRDNEMGIFMDSVYYYEELCINAHLKYDLIYEVHYETTYIHKDIAEGERIMGIINSLGSHFFKCYPVNKKMLFEYIRHHIKSQRKNNKSTSISPNILGNIIKEVWEAQ